MGKPEARTIFSPTRQHVLKKWQQLSYAGHSSIKDKNVLPPHALTFQPISGPEVENYVQEDMANIKVGGVEDFTNFVNAVIDEASFVKLSNAIDAANKSEDAEVIIGGHYDMSAGYFIQPTIIQAFQTGLHYHAGRIIRSDLNRLRL